MLANLRMTVTESIRYRGRLGHYSWLAHRLSGLAILFFLLIHVWDGANLHYSPHNWAWMVAVFKHPFFGIGEIAVYAAVIYHAFNGIRITILDFKPELWHLQSKSATIVWVLALLIIIPVTLMLLGNMVEACQHPPVWKWAGKELTGNSCWSFPPHSFFTKLP